MRKKYHFAFVSNSAEIASTVKAFSDPAKEFVEIRLATMEEALSEARDLLNRDVEVVLGGGATGKLLRKSLDQPAVTIARTTLDILRALIKAKETSKEVVLTNFDSPTEGLELYESLLDISIDQLVFKTTAELVHGLERKLSQGHKVVVGSGICREICRSFSAESIVIYPSREVIIRALEEARAIAQAQRRERSNAHRLNAILQSISEGVITIDSRGTVTLLNEPGAKILRLKPEKVMGRTLPDVMRGMGMLKVLETGEPTIEQIRRIAGSDMVVNTLPVESGGVIRSVVSSFKPASHIESIDRKLKEKLYNKGLVARYTMGHLKGDSEEMVQLRNKAELYAATDTAVLILGETGTGKELLAQAIHNASSRRDKPFVAVNCAALPESLLESELFGYEEGAFTGAKRGGKRGLFELANEGTIFLDEIADISPNLQVRLLRVIEEREIMRVGGDRIVSINVRLISSTCRDLVQDVHDQRFRSDLYFRLSVLQLVMPPLRNISEDIPLLLRDLFQRCGIPRQKANELMTPKVKARLAAYTWPGNVRELDSLVQRFAALRGNDEGEETELFMQMVQEIQQTGFDSPKPSNRTRGEQVSGSKVDGGLKQQVSEFERQTILKVLEECGNDRQQAAYHLGISMNTLWRKLKQ